jgi:hypothetical protein
MTNNESSRAGDDEDTQKRVGEVKIPGHTEGEKRASAAAKGKGIQSDTAVSEIEEAGPRRTGFLFYIFLFF